MLRRLAEQRQHGSTTWHVSQTPPGQVIYGYGNTYAGKEVSPESSLTVSAVYACIRGIAETVGSLPKMLYRRLPNGGKRRAFEHPLYKIIHDSINPEMTAQLGWELGAGHAAGWGNAFYQIIRNGAGEVAELWPLRPDRTNVVRVEGAKFYHYRKQNGEVVIFPANEVMHVPGFGFDGLLGYSPLFLARNAAAMSMAAEEFGGKFFANDARPGFVIKHPKALGDKAFKRMQEEWNEEYQGSSNSHKAKILEEGMDIKEIGIPPEDAQFLETRSFQVAEIARFYRFPLALLEEHDKAATYASVEQFMLSFVIHTIRPWLIRFEQAISFNLLTEKERNEYFCETLVDSLLRGDIQTRYQAYATGRQWGWLSADDILGMENRNPLPNGQGQSYLVPLNMVPASTQRGMEPVIQEAAERIARRELHDLGDGLKRKKEPEQWTAWLDSFYQDHKNFMARALEPVVRSYANLMNCQAPDLNVPTTNYIQANLEALRSMSGSEHLNELLVSWEKDLPTLIVRMVYDLFMNIPKEAEANHASH